MVREVFAADRCGQICHPPLDFDDFACRVVVHLQRSVFMSIRFLDGAPYEISSASPSHARGLRSTVGQRIPLAVQLRLSEVQTLLSSFPAQQQKQRWMRTPTAYDFM